MSRMWSKTNQKTNQVETMIFHSVPLRERHELGDREGSNLLN
jgi:hypothetical protein